MPDWKQIVRENLRVVGVRSPEFTEELAGHLEDSYEALLHEGMSPEVAFHRTMSQIEGRRRIWLALRFLREGVMAGFVRKVFLPGLLTSAASVFSSWASEDLLRVHPRFIFMHASQIQQVRVFLYMPLCWWCLLPVCGVLGALLSQRNGGSRQQCIVAVLFPSAFMGAWLFLGRSPFLTTLLDLVRHHLWDSAHWELLGLSLLSYAVIPAVFLLLGVGVAERIGKVSSQTPCKI
ncbi:MAG: permease prefix domain 1-containing protein [Candidatus Sulfotelmatobacter sp.]